eukprot:3232518-Prymnesium_polylepis.1
MPTAPARQREIHVKRYGACVHHQRTQRCTTHVSSSAEAADCPHRGRALVRRPTFCGLMLPAARHSPCTALCHMP